MSGIFNVENRFFRGLERFADLIWLNILWFLCCIPIITIGASTTALYYTAMRMAKNEESYITRNFFHSFKQNFVQATIIWLISLVFVVVLFMDIVFFGSNEGILFRGLMILLGVCGIFYFFSLVYVFPLLARFDNTIFNMIKNAAILSIANIPKTILIVLIIIIPYGIIYVVPYLAIVMILIGGSGTAYLTGKILVLIFDKLASDSEKQMEEQI